MDKFPEYVNKELTLANKALKTEDYNKAIKSLERIVKKYREFWQVWYQLATIYTVQDKYEDALNCLENVFDMEPAYEDAWKLKIDCLIALRRFKEALFSINGYLKTYSNEEILNIKIEILFALGEFEDVISTCLKLLKEEFNLEYVKNICQSLLYMGHFAQVLDWITYLRNHGYNEEWMEEFEEEAQLGS
jgi:tetratricopeptide (TPR) repeat protein